MERKNGKFVQVYDPSLPNIEGNEDELKQVFLNLVKNAVEASPEGGQVRVVTQFRSNYALRKVQDTSSAHNIIVKIIDSGPGMTDAALKNLFTLFLRLRNAEPGWAW